MKRDPLTIGRPRRAKVVGGVARKLLQTRAVDFHLVVVHVARAIEIERQPLAIGAQSHHLDTLGGGHDGMRCRNRDGPRTREREGPETHARGPCPPCYSSARRGGDSVYLETRSQSLRNIIRFGPVQPLMIEISAAARV